MKLRNLLEADARMQLTDNGTLPTHTPSGRKLTHYAFRMLEPVGAFVMVGQAPSNEFHGPTEQMKGVYSHEPIEPDEIILLLFDSWRVVRNHKAYVLTWSAPTNGRAFGGADPKATAASLIRGGKMTFADIPTNLDYDPPYEQYGRGMATVIEGRRIKAMDTIEKAKRFAAFMDEPRDQEETLAMLDRRDLIDDSGLRDVIVNSANPPKAEDCRPYISGFMRRASGNTTEAEQIVWRALKRYAYEMDNGELLMHSNVWDSPDQAARAGLRIYKKRTNPEEDTGLRNHDQWLERHITTHVADPRAAHRVRRLLTRRPSM